MITTLMDRWRPFAAACAVAGLAVLTAAGWSGEGAAAPVAQLPSTAPEVAEVLTRARVDGDWVRYVDVATGGALSDTDLADAARSAGLDLAWGLDPGADVELVRAWPADGTAVVWVRAAGAEVHTWEWTLARVAGAWRVVEVDRDPGGEPIPAG